MPIDLFNFAFEIFFIYFENSPNPANLQNSIFIMAKYRVIV